MRATSVKRKIAGRPWAARNGKKSFMVVNLALLGIRWLCTVRNRYSFGYF